MSDRVSPSSRRRFVRRRRAGRVLSLRPAFVIGVLACLVAGAVWAIEFSSLFDAREVRIVGLTPTTGLSEQRVRQVAAVPLGRPLARIDLTAVRVRLVDTLPAVRSATVSRSWLHTIVVQIHERRPAAIWRDGDRLSLVDTDGVAFRTLDSPSQAPAGLLIVETDTTASAGRERLVRAAGATVAAALPKPLARQVRTIVAASPDDVTLKLTGGRSVKWGSAEKSTRKADVLAALMKQNRRVYDVSVPGFPTVRN